MLCYNWIYLRKGTDVAKINKCKECMFCHYWNFNDGFKFQGSIFNGCHDLMLLCLNISDIPIINVKNVDYQWNF